MRTTILAGMALLLSTGIAAHAQQGPTWTGRDVAATAQPLTVVDLSASAQRRGERVVTRDSGRDIGFRPPRSIYVDPYGNVTTFAGAVPYWAQGQSYETRGYTPEERRFYGQQPQQQVQQQSPCVVGSGPATASSAIAQAAGGSGCGR